MYGETYGLRWGRIQNFLRIKPTHQLHACEVTPMKHTHEMHAYEVHADEMHAREMHTGEVYAREMHAYEMHAHEGFCEDLAR
jgi:hypothetical protein